MRTVPTEISTKIDSVPTENLSLARCVKLTLRDGSEIGLTDHDQNLTATLASDDYGSLEYVAGTGAVLADIEEAVGFDADTTELMIPIGEIVTVTQVVGRRLNHAVVEIFDIDWSVANPTPVELLKGLVADVRIEGRTAVLEIRSNNDYWNIVIGEVLSPRCGADYGDDRCGATVVPVNTTVTAVTSSQQFTIDLAGVHEDNYFRFGKVQFLSGPLAGTMPMEVVNFTGSTATVQLLAPAPEAPEVGDSLWIAQGCSRLKEAEDASIPTCLYHDNVINFRGADQVPGSDTYLRFPVPGGD